MRSLPVESIDTINTDPPYNLGKNYGKNLAGRKFSDRKTDRKYWSWMREVFKEGFRILKDGGSLYVSHTDHGIFHLKPMLEKIGFTFMQILVWYGRNGYSGRARTRWMYRMEPILYFYKGTIPALIQGKGLEWYTDVIEVPRPQSNFKEGRFHVAQKPVKLYRILIQRAPGEIVLDPFMGSGTTALACLQLGRRFIGFEQNPEYVKITKKRMVPWLQQTRLSR